jgi:hypothetical protein
MTKSLWIILLMLGCQPTFCSAGMEAETKLDKNFASKLSTTQLLIPISTIHHAQQGPLLKCSCTPKYQNTPGGIDKGKGAPGIEVQGDGRRNQACAGPDWYGTRREASRPASLTRCHRREMPKLMGLL